MNKPSQVRCACRKVIYDGEVIKSRAVKLVDVCGTPLAQAKALCGRCKRWVAVPAVYLQARSQTL